MLTQHLGVVEDLHGELARGRQDQRADAASRCGPARWIRQQALIQRHQERGGLAGAGLGLAGDILAREGNRQSHRLDRVWRGRSRHRVMPLGDFGNEIERSERELGKVCLCH